MRDAMYAFPVDAGAGGRESLLLAHSLIRVLGDAELAPRHTIASGRPGHSIFALAPISGVTLSVEARRAFATLNVSIEPYSIDERTLAFPFAAKVYAAAAAEQIADSSGSTLIWLDCDTLVVRPPTQLQGMAEKSLVCCPIHHSRIGPDFDLRLDPFWQLIYEVCGVPEGRTFLMHTAVDGQRIRPHFSAGLLAVRPELGLLRSWRELFAHNHRQLSFESFYQHEVRYRIFVHQAFLTGAVLARLAPDAIGLLPATYNYPLHLHASHPSHRAAKRLNELTTCRYDSWSFFQDAKWRDILPIDEPLRSWLTERLGLLSGPGLITDPLSAPHPAP